MPDYALYTDKFYTSVQLVEYLFANKDVLSTKIFAMTNRKRNNIMQQLLQGVQGKKYLRAKQMNPQTKDKDLLKCCKTAYRCKYCEEFLCIGKPESNCWFD